MIEPIVKKKPGEFRIGKTRRDHASGSWSQRIRNNIARGNASRGKERNKG